MGNKLGLQRNIHPTLFPRNPTSVLSTCQCSTSRARQQCSACPLKTTRMGASTKTQGEPKPQSPEEPVAIWVPEVCCPCGAGSSQSPRHTALCWAPPAAGWVLATTLPFFWGFWAGMGQGGCCPMSVLSTELCLSGSFPWQTKNPPEKSMYREQLGRHGSRTGGVN